MPKYGFLISRVKRADIKVNIIPITASMKEDVNIFTKKQPTLNPTIDDGNNSGKRHKPSPGRIWKNG